MSDNAIVSVNSLACLAGYRPLFSNLAFSLNPGQWIELTGPNGTGKTTLLRCLAGLTQPVTGTFEWQQKATRTTALEWRASLLYQGHAPAIKNALTAAENLTTWLTLDNGKPPTDQTIAQLLETAGISNCAALEAISLSAGQRRRIQLARLSGAKSRPLWLLDEPANALDKDGLSLLNRLLDEHLANGGCAIVATHQPLLVSTSPLLLHMPTFAPVFATIGQSANG